MLPSAAQFALLAPVKAGSRGIARVTHATYAIPPTMGALLRPYLCPVALPYVLPFVRC